MSLLQTARLFVPVHIRVELNVALKDYVRDKSWQAFLTLTRFLFKVMPPLWGFTVKTSAVATAIALFLLVGYLVTDAFAPKLFDFGDITQATTQQTLSKQPEIRTQAPQFDEEHYNRVMPLLRDTSTQVQPEPAPESQAQVLATPVNTTSALLLEDIDVPVEPEPTDLMFTFDQDENLEGVTLVQEGITAGYSGVNQEVSDSLNGLSLERTDKTWAGRALPLSTVRQIVAQYNWNIEKALRIIFCESGRNPRVVNDNPNTRDYSIGLFQINLFRSLENVRPSEEWLKNPINNVDYAYRLYRQLGWKPWKTCSAKADQAMSRS